MPSQAFDIEAWIASLPEGELVRFRQLIDKRLPMRNLLDINVEHEVIAQYVRLNELLDDIRHDEAVPASQKGTVANAVTAALTNLAKLQNEVYDSERVKRLKSVFVDVLNQVEDKERLLSLFQEACDARRV